MRSGRPRFRYCWLYVIAAGAFSLGVLSAAGAAPDCSTEAAILKAAQSELPRLDVASPQDRPPYCITLETIMGFAVRVQAHIAHCPSSEYAPDAAEWVKKRADYAKRFAQYRCKRTQ